MNRNTPGAAEKFFRSGAELIGLDDVASDSEVIGLMIECLRTIGLQSFKVSAWTCGLYSGAPDAIRAVGAGAEIG